MHLVRSHRLMYVQVPQLVPNLIFPYSGRGFSPLVPILQSIDSGGARREVASRRLREKNCGVPQPFPHLLILGHHSCSSGGYAFFNLLFLVDIPVESHLVIISIPCQVQLQPHLGTPDPIPT